jgi:hypothetical protein
VRALSASAHAPAHLGRLIGYGAAFVNDYLEKAVLADKDASFVGHHNAGDTEGKDHLGNITYVAGVAKRLVLNMSASSFHANLVVSGDSAHHDTPKSGLRSGNVLLLYLPGKHAAGIAYGPSTEN